MARRELIKKTAKVGAVAWTVPLVVDGLTNPAAAATCAKGNFSVIFTDPGGVLTNPTTAPVGLPAVYTGTLVTATAVGLALTGGPFNHAAATPGNVNPVTLKVTGCACLIQSVYAAVHLQGAGTCPAPYYFAATPGGQVNLTAGTLPAPLPSTVITIVPNLTAGLYCTTALHWGTPTTAPNNPQVFADGFVVVNIKC
jgi:hypothetical protein